MENCPFLEILDPPVKDGCLVYVARCHARGNLKLLFKWELEKCRQWRDEKTGEIRCPDYLAYIRYRRLQNEVQVKA